MGAAVFGAIFKFLRNTAKLWVEILVPIPIYSLVNCCNNFGGTFKQEILNVDKYFVNIYLSVYFFLLMRQVPHWTVTKISKRDDHENPKLQLWVSKMGKAVFQKIFRPIVIGIGYKDWNAYS